MRVSVITIVKKNLAMMSCVQAVGVPLQLSWLSLHEGGKKTKKAFILQRQAGLCMYVIRKEKIQVSTLK